MNFKMVPEAPDELWPEGIPVCLPQPLDSAYIPPTTGNPLPHQEAHFLFVQITFLKSLPCIILVSQDALRRRGQPAVHKEAPIFFSSPKPALEYTV